MLLVVVAIMGGCAIAAWVLERMFPPDPRLPPQNVRSQRYTPSHWSRWDV